MPLTHVGAVQERTFPNGTDVTDINGDVYGASPGKAPLESDFGRTEDTLILIISDGEQT